MWLPFFPAFVYTERHALNSTDIILRVPHNSAICKWTDDQKNHKKHTVHEYLALYVWLALSQM